MDDKEIGFDWYIGGVERETEKMQTKTHAFKFTLILNQSNDCVWKNIWIMHVNFMSGGFFMLFHSLFHSWLTRLKSIACLFTHNDSHSKQIIKRKMCPYNWLVLVLVALSSDSNSKISHK